jgi:isopentenyl-diphosphate Delta-isomerase
MQMAEVILVNEKDEVLGKEEKMKAHIEGLLHRAFSIFIFNSKGEMLLQQRAIEKYHSGGLWTNACCSHPAPDESTATAALRRLQEEMGFVTTITKQFDFVYKAAFSNQLTEYEFDHVFTGVYDGIININKEEVMSYCYKSMADITKLLERNPEQYTAWFQIAFPKVRAWWATYFNFKVA